MDMLTDIPAGTQKVSKHTTATIYSEIYFLWMNGKLLFPNVCLRVHVISAITTENKVWCPVEMCLQMNTIQGEEVGMIISERRESWAGPLM